MKTKLVMTYNAENVKKPLISQAIKNFDIEFNILKAEIDGRLCGKIYAEIEGSSLAISNVLNFLTENGVETDLINGLIYIETEKCMDCGLCTSVCPTRALSTSEPEWLLKFDHYKCISCGLCLKSCPSRAIKERTA